MADIGEEIQVPANYKLVGLSTGTLAPEWREVFDEMFELINALSVKVKELDEAQDDG